MILDIVLNSSLFYNLYYWPAIIVSEEVGMIRESINSGSFKRRPVWSGAGLFSGYSVNILGANNAFRYTNSMMIQEIMIVCNFVTKIPRRCIVKESGSNGARRRTLKGREGRTASLTGGKSYSVISLMFWYFSALWMKGPMNIIILCVKNACFLCTSNRFK